MGERSSSINRQSAALKQPQEALFDTHSEVSLDFELVRQAARQKYTRPFLILDTAIVRGKWKLVDTGSTHELYDMHADPNERSNIASTRMQVVSELRGLLQKYVTNASRSPFE